MNATRASILDKAHEHAISMANPEHFKLDSQSDFDASIALTDPRISLYCFDLANDAALFVEVADAPIIENATFLYNAQFEHATHVISIPTTVFCDLAETIPLPVGGLIFLHSVSRCGSTLLSKVFQSIPGIYSLSEPDEPTQLGRLKATGGAPDELIKSLLYASTRWRCKPQSSGSPHAVAIKYRSEVIVLHKEFEELYPNEHHIFQYRDGISWIRSVFLGWPRERDIDDAEKNAEMQLGWSNTVPLIAQQTQPLNAIQIRILAWINAMETYYSIADSGIPIIAIRYEDLRTDPRPILRKMLEFCEISEVDWNAIELVLGEDSQAGTVYDRAKRSAKPTILSDAQVDEALKMIAGRPRLRTPGVILPKTLQA
ncbi:sulfotransferase [soil metagenome]